MIKTGITLIFVCLLMLACSASKGLLFANEVESSGETKVCIGRVSNSLDVIDRRLIEVTTGEVESYGDILYAIAYPDAICQDLESTDYWPITGDYTLAQAVRHAKDIRGLLLDDRAVPEIVLELNCRNSSRRGCSTVRLKTYSKSDAHYMSYDLVVGRNGHLSIANRYLIAID